MPKVVYTSTQGLVQQAGAGVQLETTPFSPVRTLTGTAAGPNAVVGSPGVYLFNVGAASTGSMPLASSYPGGVFIVRAGSAHIYCLTGSAEAAGTQVFKAPVTGSGTPAVGSKIALATTTGAVFLQSDGVNFCVIGQNGQITYSGT